ncbi:MAG: hypothetical protein IT373_25440, partial [Polyangiaceae bacterium]|nr:hypothetical protein [Polyangiaceae bacterium]
VTFDPWDDAAVDRVGPALERAVPGGTNVELCRVSEGGRRIEVVVWERGVGRTLACGTGAVAAAGAAIAAGLARHDEPITVALPGGELVVTVDRAWQARMLGPAERVFEGELPEPGPDAAGARTP